MIRSPISTGFLSSVGLAETWKQFNHGLLNRTFTPDTTCNGRDGTWELDNQKTGKHGATRYVRVPAINSPHAHSVRCCSQTIYLGVTESRNDTTWPDTGWSQQNQQIPQPAAAKAATGIGLLPLNNSVEIN
ncbi:hypothetical protein J6590_082654 [Homalodisca vitripennis]|nr:hypothetical protein J6590_082654 [Homalodisca vitripennis]